MPFTSLHPHPPPPPNSVWSGFSDGAVANTVSRRLLTAEPTAQFQVIPCGIELGGKNVTGKYFAPASYGALTSLAFYRRSINVKVKVTFTLEQATKGQTGSRGIAPLFP